MKSKKRYTYLLNILGKRGVSLSKAVDFDKLNQLYRNLLRRYRYTVAGRITDRNNAPVPYLIVRAYDVDLERTTFLGETLTSSNGRYSIAYGAEQLSAGAKNYANLRIEVFSFVGESLSESDIHFKAARRHTIDLTIEAPAKLTEYEQLVGTLQFL